MESQLSEEQNQPTIKQDKWKSDQKNEEYYKMQWIQTVKIAGLDEKENEYINIIFTQMHDANEQGALYLKMWKRSEYALIGLAALVTFLNTVAASVINNVLLSATINIFAALFAAAISIISGIKVLSAYKETWLRHSKFRYTLEMECQCFVTDSGEYANITQSDDNSEACSKELAIEKIKLFKKNTTKLIQDDYDNFFSNMRVHSFNHDPKE